MTDKELALYIAKGGSFTILEPQKVSKKQRIKHLGRKQATSTRKARENITGLPPKLKVYF